MYQRNGIWYITVSGVKTSSGTRDKARAKRLEHRLNAEAWDNAHGFVIPTWDRACLKWMNDNPVSSEAYSNTKMLKYWRPHLTGKKLTDITPDLIHQIALTRGVDPLNPSKRNTTANQYVQFVSKIIRHVSNLKPKFEPYPKPTNESYLKPDQWLRISAKLDEDARDVLTFLLATGLREANAMFFEWAWWDGDKAVIPAGSTKTEKPYGIPLNEVAQRILRRRGDMTVKHVKYAFTRSGVLWYRLALLRALKRACVDSGEPKIIVHTLRHTFITWLAQKGVPKEIRMRLAGHARKDAHDIYTHHDVESLRPFASVIGSILLQSSSKSKQALEK